MKKVILAILMVASKEKVNCDVTISTKGGHYTSTGAIELEGGDNLTLKVWRAGDTSSLTLSPDDSDLSVNFNESGRYEIAVGGICITFQQPFKQDPFTVNG